MKIIVSNYDDTNNPYYGGGGAIAIHEIVKRLALQHDATVITGRYKGSNDVNKDKVRYKRIGIDYGGPKLGQLVFQFLLPFYISKMDFDIWIESFTPPFSTAFLPLFTKKPVIGLAHLLGGDAKSKQYGLPFHLIERKGLSVYKNFIVLTEYTKNKIKQYSPFSHIEVIPNGFPAFYIKKKFVKRDEYILFMGRIELEQKGLDLLIDAYKLIEGKTNRKLVIAGSGIKKEEEYVKLKIKKLGLKKKVIFLGKVEGKKKEKIIENSSFVVLPSRFEAFPLVALEAFVHKTPIVWYDISDLSWIPKYCGIKVKAFDIQKFAKAMLTLSTQKDLRRTMGNRAYKYASKYTWDNIATFYSNYLGNVHTKHSHIQLRGKKSKIKTPLMREIIIGGLISHFGLNLVKSKYYNRPRNIGAYEFIEKISKNSIENEFDVALYQRDGNKYFIKTWRGSFKDLHYYSLFNEYLSSKNLFEKANSSRFQIKFSKPVEILSHKNSLSVVFEYIQGQKLSELSSRKQLVVYRKVLKELSRLSTMLSPNDKKKYSQRDLPFYMFALVFFSIQTIISSPKKTFDVTKYVINCLKNYRFLNSSLTIAHRDLTPQNIIISGKNIYILDCERLVLTLSGYDEAYLAMSEHTTFSLRDIFQNISKSNLSFFIHYLAVHFEKNKAYVHKAESFIQQHKS